MDVLKREHESDVMKKAKQVCLDQFAKHKSKLLVFPLSFARREQIFRKAAKVGPLKTRGRCSVARGLFGFYRHLFLSLQDQNLMIYASEAEIGMPALHTIRLITVRMIETVYWFKLKTKEECDQWLYALQHVPGLLRRVSDFYAEDHKCGEGATCIVQKCNNKLTGSTCALKKRIDLFDELGRQGMYNELRILQILSKNPHPAIPVLEDYFFDKTGDIKIVMEFMNRGELLAMIEQEGGLNEATARDLFYQIADGVRHLHENCIAHRDIKPSNIMILERPDGKLQCKLIDYDLAKENYAEHWFACNPCGTAEFMAPEILQNKLYTLAVDIWSLGCVLYGMLIGHCPFGGANHQETRCNILNNRIQISDLDAISTEAKDLILKMLEPCPERRLTAKEVLEHPWLHLQP